ncbi:uncharacterized [Tachysurus ichikawai]
MNPREELNSILTLSPQRDQEDDPFCDGKSMTGTRHQSQRAFSRNARIVQDTEIWSINAGASEMQCEGKPDFLPEGAVCDGEHKALADVQQAKQAAHRSV